MVVVRIEFGSDISGSSAIQLLSFGLFLQNGQTTCFITGQSVGTTNDVTFNNITGNFKHN